MKLWLALIASTLVLTACGNTSQDPLEGVSGPVRNGQPPEYGKPVAEKPYPKEALHIDGPNYVNGIVNSPMEIRLSGRVTIPGVGFQITILNLAEFEGATFDPSSGEFKWTPDKSVVGTSTVGQATLRVQLATIPTPENPVISTEMKEITLVITNSYTKPLVVSITGNNDIAVGWSYYYDFEIEDRDAVIPANAAVIVRNCPDAFRRESLFGLVEQSGDLSVSTTGPHRYKGRVIVDLDKADTLKTATYCFALTAVSKSGLVSDLFLKTIDVSAKIQKSKMTLESYLILNVGETMQASFSFYDPTGDGILNVKNIEDISSKMPGSKVECVAPSYNKAILNCMATIDARTAAAGTYSVGIDVETSSKKTRPPVMTNHWLKIQVKAAP